jgi:hypothetical protein
MRISWGSGASVQEHIAAKWKLSYLCVIILLLLLLVVVVVVVVVVKWWKCRYGLFRNVSTGSRATVKLSCCRGWYRLLVGFPLAWTASHTTEEVNTAWTSKIRTIGWYFVVLLSSSLNPMKQSCDYKCKVSRTQKISVHFTFRISRYCCYKQEVFIIKTSWYCSVRQEISYSVCLRWIPCLKFN